MDNAYPEIDDVRLKSGRELLALTDAIGFGAYAAAWVYDRSTSVWRYVLSTPMLQSHGPAWVYERLLKVFNKIELPEGICPLDIFVIDPRVEVGVLGEPDILAVGPTPAGMETVITLRDADLGSFSVGYGLVVFLRRLPTRDRKRDPSRTFDRRVRDLAA